MKSLLYTLVALFLFIPAVAKASDRPAIYPFDVKIGGQTAAVEGDPAVAVFAKIKDPVANDAELEVSGDPGMLIINIFPVKANGEVDPAAPPKIIMVQSGNKTKLSETMDKSTLAAGLWGANIVFNNGTSRVMFTVK
jgi:hypothetical protein